jgi:DNA-binding MarR family transcriptional regulator
MASTEDFTIMCYSVPLQRVTTTTIEVLQCIYSFSGEGVWGLEIAKLTGLKTGTVYPILERLESLGWLNSEWEITQDRNGPRRRTYRLTVDASREMRELTRKLPPVHEDAKSWNLALRQGVTG